MLRVARMEGLGRPCGRKLGCSYCVSTCWQRAACWDRAPKSKRWGEKMGEVKLQSILYISQLYLVETFIHLSEEPTHAPLGVCGAVEQC